MTTDRTPAEAIANAAHRHRPGRWDDDHWESCDPSHPDASCAECDAFWPCDTELLRLGFTALLAQLAEEQAKVAALHEALKGVIADEWGAGYEPGDREYARAGALLADLQAAATRYTEQAEQRGAEKERARLLHLVMTEPDWVGDWEQALLARRKVLAYLAPALPTSEAPVAETER